MAEPIISVSGLRGVIGESLTPEIAARYVSAFVAGLPPGPVVVSRDGRASGPMLAEVIQQTLTARGRTCLDAGVAATPTLGVLVREQQAAGGIQISASHNPPEYNGLKLFSAAGRVIPKADGEQVIAAYRGPASDAGLHGAAGEVVRLPDTVSRHWELVRATVDVERIRACKFRVLLDANRGSGSVLGRRLLEELNCQVTLLGETPDGQFEHPPEPTAENLSGVLAAVRQAGAAIGFCQDPDADRLAVIDADGNYLGEEYTLALCVDHVLREAQARGKLGPVVTNCSTSRMSEDLAAKYGVPFFRSAVGEANVVDRMLACGALLGGEGNGGAIDPRVGLVRDSFVGMALILAAMAKRQMPVATLAAELPRYEIHKTKYTVPAERLTAALSALERRFSDATFDRLDGLRLDWPGKWLLVRASNTEPIVRAIAEAPTAAEARRLCDEAGQAIRAAVSS